MKGIAIYHMSAPELEKMLKYRWVVAGGKEEDLPFPEDRSAYQVNRLRVLFTRLNHYHI